jgi:hypothetical protein
MFANGHSPQDGSGGGGAEPLAYPLVELGLSERRHPMDRKRRRRVVREQRHNLVTCEYPIRNASQPASSATDSDIEKERERGVRTYAKLGVDNSGIACSGPLSDCRIMNFETKDFSFEEI